MAIGTETIGKVDLLAGPGNAYVAEAKRQLFGEVGIDLFAGPTEILVVADEHADPFVVAVDLLSQAEHGPDSPAVLITTSETLGPPGDRATSSEILPDMPTRDFAEPGLARPRPGARRRRASTTAYALADEYASEHVQILTANPREALERMRNYGALFLGEGTCVSYGDKVIGTNHTLPTRGAARYTGGLWVGKYLKTVTYQEVTDPAASADLGELCGRAARVELFEGHARSGDVRAWKYAGRRAALGPGQPVTPALPGRRPIAGRTALVTGAGNGLGRAIALALAHHGARVILAGRRPATLDAVAAEIGADVAGRDCDTSAERVGRRSGRVARRARRCRSWSTTPGSPARSRRWSTSRPTSGTRCSPSTCAACS